MARHGIEPRWLSDIEAATAVLSMHDESGRQLGRVASSVPAEIAC
jgi:hypothetical protein